MTAQQYIEPPILLSAKETADLVDVDTKPVTIALQSSLQTLHDLNAQITAQLANHCVLHKKDTPPPISITVTILSPLTGKLD
ncbi:hypothetical protein MNBD_GAMMA10-1103 [hydrothermal vent metagenome]|uniref:Uncharacterized protein n=1 Tax=hydrothermal vent metagenome TaxID=652676 RepID=A0A3B0Y1X0_9ZZZZ